MAWVVRSATAIQLASVAGVVSRAARFVSNSQPMSVEVEQGGQFGRCPPQTSAVPRLAFSIREAAQMLGVCEKSVRRLIERGLLKTSRALRHHRVTKQEVERFLKDTM